MLLCDGAQVADGKLFVLGGGWSLTGPDPMPSAIAMKSARATNFRPGSYWKELFPIDIVHSSSFLMNFTVLDRNAFTLHAVS